MTPLLPDSENPPLIAYVPVSGSQLFSLQSAKLKVLACNENMPIVFQSNNEADIPRKMFLGGLPPNMTENSLRDFYLQFGEVVDIVIMRDLATNRSRGFGFITFKDAACVDRAQTARPHIIEGRSIDSKRVLARKNTTKSSVSTSGRKIFVGALKDVHDEEALAQHFKQFGSVLNVKVLVDKNTGRKRGFAYVEFDDYDSADKAVLHRNHTIKYLTVDVKKSNYKEEQAKKMASQSQPNAVPSTGGPQQNGPSYAYPPAPYPPPYGYPPAPAYGGWGAPPAPYPPAQPPAYGAPPPAWNGWGYAGAPPAAPPPTTNGNYQQSYNGGPQKGGKLQNYRNNPYKS